MLSHVLIVAVGDIYGGAVMNNQFVALPLLALILGFAVTGYAQEGEKPPLSKGRIAGEFFAGVAVGTATAVIPFSLLMLLFPLNDSTGGPAGFLTSSSEVVTMCAYLCLPVGYAIGSATGVYLVGNRGNETGSFLLPLIGSSLVVTGGLAATFLSGHWGFIPVILVGAPAVATIIFNSTRKYKSSTPR